MSTVKAIVEQGTEQFLLLDNLADRLEWWLISAYSSERWLQFEWAFAVSKAFSKEYVVSCEHKLVDVALFKQHRDLNWPIWSNEPSVGFEIKWLGNWYLRGRVNGVAEDVAKVNTRNYPSAALAFFLEVEANPQFPEYAWIQQQIEQKTGGTREELEELLKKSINHPGDQFHYYCKEISSIRFKLLKLHIYAFENRPNSNN